MTIEVDTETTPENEEALEQAAFQSSFDGDDDEYVIDDGETEGSIEDQSDDDSSEDDASEEAETQEKKEEEISFSELRAQLEQEKEEKQKLADRVRNIEGRYGTLNSELTKLKTEKSEYRGYPTPSKEELEEAKASIEKLDELKVKYEKWGEEVDAREALTLARLGISEFASKEEIAEILEKRSEGYVSKEEFSAILERERETLKLELKHPDWMDTINSKGYEDWLEQQDESTRALIKSTKSADAIKLLDKYNRDIEEKDAAEREKEEKNSRLESAVPATSSSRTSRPARKTEHDDFLSGFGS